MQRTPQAGGGLMCLDGLAVMGPWGLCLTYFGEGPEVATIEIDLLRGWEVFEKKEAFKNPSFKIIKPRGITVTKNGLIFDWRCLCCLASWELTCRVPPDPTKWTPDGFSPRVGLKLPSPISGCLFHVISAEARLTCAASLLIRAFISLFLEMTPVGWLQMYPSEEKWPLQHHCPAHQKVRPQGHSLLMANTVTAAFAQWRFAAFSSLTAALCCWAHLCSAH